MKKVLTVFRAEIKRAHLSRDVPVGEGLFACGRLAISDLLGQPLQL